MKKEELRKVSYYQEEPNQGFDPDNLGNMSQPVEGYFHVWGITPYRSPFDGSYYNRTVGYVENAQTGEIEEILAERIKFTD